MHRARMTALVAAAALAAFAAGCSDSSTGPAEPTAATYVVDIGGSGDYTSIGSAVAAAVDGDTLLVLPGIYSGPDNRSMAFTGRAITLVSRGGADSTTIDLEGEGRAFALHGRGRAESFIAGFTITGGFAVRGGAVAIVGASPTLSDLVFLNNEADDQGGAVYVSGGSPILRGVRFESNEAYFNGGGMFCQSGASPVLEDVVFEENEAGSGAGLAAVFSTLSLEDVWFGFNEAFNDGGGMYLGGSDATLDTVVFYENIAPARGGGLACSGSSPVIEHASFIRNGGVSGGGISLREGSAPSITNTIIAFQYLGEAIAADEESEPTVVRACVHQNFGGNDIGTIGVDVINVDPLFCGLYVPDLTLCANSPCLPENNTWGEQLGAYSEGCSECSSSGFRGH